MSAAKKDIVCVILCAGKGTRMQSDQTHKVCFPLAGRPAINRILDAFKSVGVSRFVAVVGDKAGQVISTISSEHPEATYVFQGEQKGTGHAAGSAAEALERLGYQGNVLITMGDKFIEPRAIEQIVESFHRSGADLIFAVAPKGQSSSAGRVLIDPAEERVLASIEVRDIQRARIMGKFAELAGRNGAIPRSKLRRIVGEHIADAKKAAKAIGPALAGLIAGEGSIPTAKLREAVGPNPGMFNVDGRTMSADEVESSAKVVNVSLYLGKSEAVFDALRRLRPDNAQGEYYLTDVVTMLASARDTQGRHTFKVRAHRLSDASDILGFNNPQELLAIEDHLRRRGAAVKAKPQAPDRVGRLGGDRLKPVSQWISLFEKFPPKLRRVLKDLYGADEKFLADRRKAYLDVLKLFARRYSGDAEVLITRAPGRVNLMGRHVDHRGGYVNVMAINREVIMVAARRDDDRVRLAHVTPEQFADDEFSIGQLIGSMVWDDWLSYINSRQVQQLVVDSKGAWGNYVRAPLLRLQQQYRDVLVLGMDVAVAGNVPMAAGLSSSSAVVVAAAEACVALNHFDVTPQQFVDLCGEGEWFVGSRGGAADHAGIRMGRRGSVARVRFFPFAVEELYQFPAGYSLLVANSHVKAAKTGNARDQFNQRVASYEFGFLMLRDRFPRYAHLLSHLRDVNPRRLGLPASEIYRMLASMPMAMTPDEVVRALSDQHAAHIERVRSSHTPPDRYPIRDVLLYGIAECERSVMARDLLANGKLDLFGQLMGRSHDGDRVVHCRFENGKLRCQPYQFDCSDTALLARISDLRSEDPDRVLAAQLWMQPGGYRCSTPQIDQMIDAVGVVPGVVGAQLSGAGLGGCVMVLVADHATGRAIDALVKGYYEPNKLEPAIEICIPVEGSGLVVV